MNVIAALFKFLAHLHPGALQPADQSGQDRSVDSARGQRPDS
jgi:hypothetical protein